MATICEFGTAPEQVADGYKGIGTVKGNDADVLDQFFSDDVRLVRGGEVANGEFEFYVMVKQVSIAVCDRSHFSAMKSKAGELILRLLLASPNNKIGFERLYRELSEAGLTNSVLEGEERRLVLDYAEELGFTVNRIYPNPILAGQVILTDAAKQKYL